MMFRRFWTQAFIGRDCYDLEVSVEEPDRETGARAYAEPVRVLDAKGREVDVFVMSARCLYDLSADEIERYLGSRARQAAFGR